MTHCLACAIGTRVHHCELGDRVSTALTSILTLVLLSPISSVRVLSRFVPSLVATRCCGRGAPTRGFEKLILKVEVDSAIFLGNYDDFQ